MCLDEGQGKELISLHFYGPCSEDLLGFMISCPFHSHGGAEPGRVPRQLDSGSCNEDRDLLVLHVLTRNQTCSRIVLRP